jgi:hypothetical protein
MSLYGFSSHQTRIFEIPLFSSPIFISIHCKPPPNTCVLAPGRSGIVNDNVVGEFVEETFTNQVRRERVDVYEIVSVTGGLPDMEHVDEETRICTTHDTIDNGAQLGMSSAYAMFQNEIS